MTSFRIKTCKLNTPNLKDVNATLNTFPITNSINNTASILLTPQMIQQSNTNPLLVLPSPGTGSYITINSVILFLNFNTVSYRTPEFMGSSINLIYSGGQDTTSNINDIINVLLQNNNNFGFTLSSQNNLSSISNVLNSGIYLSSFNILTTNTNSNVSLIINYNVYSI